VVFIEKCPFHMAMKSKPVKYRIKLWVAADAKKFHAYDMQLYTGKSDRAREKNKSLNVIKGLSHVWNHKSVTADNFVTGCELANLLLTRNVTLVGTLRENKPEISSLFHSRKQREVYFLYLFYK